MYHNNQSEEPDMKLKSKDELKVRTCNNRAMGEVQKFGVIAEKDGHFQDQY